uniref:Uncharacterized protein n=1 Tax=Physcomitrium patens TaxID=3218 RepID=A0A2K1IY39_PHYPA|nr:hypothetical protein PHYPA_023998 [Physcomitrium patens]
MKKWPDRIHCLSIGIILGAEKTSSAVQALRTLGQSGRTALGTWAMYRAEFRADGKDGHTGRAASWRMMTECGSTTR